MVANELMRLLGSLINISIQQRQIYELLNISIIQTPNLKKFKRPNNQFERQTTLYCVEHIFTLISGNVIVCPLTE